MVKAVPNRLKILLRAILVKFFLQLHKKCAHIVFL